MKFENNMNEEGGGGNERFWKDVRKIKEKMGIFI